MGGSRVTNYLVKKFVKNYDQTKNAVVRQRYGRLGSLVGIFVNLLLFIGKFSAGTIFGSVAVTADGVNNLSDAGSSVVSLVSFKLAGKPADREHPYGHARIEYLAAMMVAVLILVLGIELGKTSIEKIILPEAVTFSLLTVCAVSYTHLSATPLPSELHRYSIWSAFSRWQDLSAKLCSRYSLVHRVLRYSIIISQNAPKSIGLYICRPNIYAFVLQKSSHQHLLSW